MINLPTVLVLLPVYNGEKWLGDQLDSILSQKNVLLQINISVDISNDSSLEICNWYSSKFKSINIVNGRQNSGGAAKHFFYLIQSANLSDFDFLVFTDQDDIWNSDKLSRAISEIGRTNFDAYSSNVTAFWPNGKARLINKAQPQAEWDYLFESAGPGCTFVLTNKLALELQAFVRKNPTAMQSVWMHDWFIYAFARGNGYKWLIDSQSTMLYRQHSNNVVGVNLGLKAINHRLKFILSGKWFTEVVHIATLVGQRESTFVNSWLPFSRLGFLRLALQPHKCRRKRTEQMWFFCMCLLMAVFGHKYESNTTVQKS